MYNYNFQKPLYISANAHQDNTEQIFCNAHDRIEFNNINLEQPEHFFNNNIQHNAIIIESINQKFINSFDINTKINWENFLSIDEIRQQNIKKQFSNKIAKMVEYKNLSSTLIFKKELNEQKYESIFDMTYKNFINHNKSCFNLNKKIQESTKNKLSKYSFFIEIDSILNLSGITVSTISQFFELKSFVFIPEEIQKYFTTFKEGYVISSIIQKEKSTIIYYSFCGIFDRQTSYLLNSLYISFIKLIDYELPYLIQDSLINNFYYYGYTFLSKNFIDSFSQYYSELLIQLLLNKGFEIQKNHKRFIFKDSFIDSIDCSVNSELYRRAIFSAFIKDIYPIPNSIKIINSQFIKHGVYI